MTADCEIVHERLELGAQPGARGSSEEFLKNFELDRIPTGPGCYIMKDPKGKPIYVGKAKSLRARVRQYINEQDSRYSVKFLMGKVASIDFLVTANEKEALLLENSLIKQNKPRYNVRLKDDKTYISLRIDVRQDFPRITVVRRFKKDGARYFGPYHSAHAVRQILRQIGRLFPLRTCTDHVLANRTRPCLYYQMKQCAAPCVHYINRDEYHEIVRQVIMVLEGRSKELENHLLERIQHEAESLHFEQAAVLRDRLFALRQMHERQHAVSVGFEDRDVLGYYNQGAYTEIQVLFYRGGKMLGGRDFSFEHREMPIDELLSSFLLQFYANAPVIPHEIVVPIDLEDADALAELLSDQRGGRVQVHWPQRGDKRSLVVLAEENARRNFESKRLAEKVNEDALRELQHGLILPSLPRRIECFDISTIQGNRTVGSMVTFEDGLPAKARYRRYSVRTVAGQDDFASMREVLLRRYQRAILENDLPDLVLIDGGKGQLGVAHAVLEDLGLDDLPHVSLAKSRTEHDSRSPERFFVPGRSNPIILPQKSAAIQLVSRIRDEAHRFAITYHRKQRDKATLTSRLTGIPGVGPKRARTLLNELGSVAKIREATAEEIAALPGFSSQLARTVQEHLGSNQP